MAKKTTTEEPPKYYTDRVGTKQKFGGGLFSSKKDLPFKTYTVLDWRWGSGQVFDMKKLKAKHPTIEYLLKRPGMKRSQWTRGFPVPEIKF